MYLNITKAISQKLLLLFLFLLPWQTLFIAREIFIEDTKLEYATIGFYGTEIIFWLATIFFGIFDFGKIKKQNIKHKKKLLSLFLKKITKDNKPARFLRILIMAQSIIIYLYIKNIFSGDVWLGVQHILYIQQGFLLLLLLLLSDIKRQDILHVILLGSIIPSAIGIMQFFSQMTINNSLFGLALHPVLQPGTSVVVSEISGRVLRAYGTFAHPNIFGGYIVAVVASYITLADEKLKLQPKYYAIFILLAIALFTTFSRSAWLAMTALLMLHLPRIQFKQIVKPVIAIFSIVFLVLTIFNQDIVQTRSSVASSAHEMASVTERISGIEEAVQIFENNWKHGVGVGQYTQALQMYYPYKPIWEYQPAHSAIILFLVENGILVGIMVMILLISVLQIIEIISFQFLRNSLVLATAIMPIILFDHYIYSSYVGMLILGLILGTSIVRYREDIVNILTK